MFYDHPFSPQQFRWRDDPARHLDDSECIFVHVFESASDVDEQIFFVHMELEPFRHDNQSHNEHNDVHIVPRLCE